MSAAEPADPIPTMPVNTEAGATVVQIGSRDRRGASAQTSARGRWNTVNGTPPHPSPGVPGGGELALLADHIETTFNDKHLTLTDDDTARAYILTLHVVRGHLEGAHARGFIDKTALGELTALIDGLAGVPDLAATD